MVRDIADRLDTFGAYSHLMTNTKKNTPIELLPATPVEWCDYTARVGDRMEIGRHGGAYCTRYVVVRRVSEGRVWIVPA